MLLEVLEVLMTNGVARDLIKGELPCFCCCTKCVIQSHLAVPDLALPDASLSRKVFRDLFWLHRNTPQCPGFCMFPDRMEICKFLTPAHIENIFAVPDIFLLLA